MTDSSPVETIDNLFLESKHIVCCKSALSGTSLIRIGVSVEELLLLWVWSRGASRDQAQIATSCRPAYVCVSGRECRREYEFVCALVVESVCQTYR